jgi:hypothetical protein
MGFALNSEFCRQLVRGNLAAVGLSHNRLVQVPDNFARHDFADAVICKMMEGKIMRQKMTF